jgi:putative membrane protein
MIDWRFWRNEQGFVCILIAAGWLYALLAGPLRRRFAPGEPFPRAHAVRFYGALGIFYLVVGSPFSRLASVYLFSAHMVQELAVMYPVAALVLLGLPPWMVDAALSRPGLRFLAGRLLRPFACGALFTLVIMAWHLPRAFEWALEVDAGPGLEHASVLAVSLLFWWPLLGPSRLFPPLRFAGRMIYLFCTEVALTALFTYLLMADHPIYPTYEYAPRIVASLGAVDDQVLGGILLSGVSSFVMLGVLGLSFRQWAHREKSGAGS